MARYAANRQGFGQLLQAAGVELAPNQCDTLWRYHQLLRDRNTDGDLTRLHAFETMVLLHYADCLLAVQKCADLMPEVVIDIGSGAGFPGIPLQIARPDLRGVLCEMRAKRVAFLQEAIAHCSLAQATTLHRTLGKETTAQCGGIITRAFEKVPVTLQRVAHLVPPGGVAIFLKGPSCEPEVAEANQYLAAGWRLVRDEAYAIPLTTHRRRLIVYRRLSDPTETAQRRTRTIDAASNADFKLWTELLTGRGIRKHGLALVAGSKLVAELLREMPHLCAELLVPKGLDRLPAELPPGVAVTVLAQPLHKELDVAGTKGPLALIYAAAPQAWAGQLEGATLAVPFQDPENVGAMLRSALALGVRDIVLTPEAASPYHPKALRAGGLAVLRARLWLGPPLAQLGDSVPAAALVALSAEGAPLGQFAFPDAFLLLPGLEGPGLPAHLRATAVSIPMADGTESLNAATAAALALYEWAHHRPSRDLPERGD